ncbi:NUDIX hydrolase [Natronoglomus mannanivorans]|uniref:NUDIX domain-containing protein n=1 Tax=Natronoglomus mannanivorans TaxID=2979990 RepID=A0AAP2YWS5_9EURY|nr:NUDIX domain-containing protein [Halobacteria archaeon AArc-xg1-1]
METTRHFTATVYIVNDGATALHDHRRLGITIPPGGHVDRDELPHETAIRECREETGLEATILPVRESLESDGTGDHDLAVETDTGRSLPQPRRQMLYDIDVHDGRVAHQHVDHIYYATVPSREIDPADGEVNADGWAWYTSADLRTRTREDEIGGQSDSDSESEDRNRIQNDDTNEPDLEDDVVTLGLEAIEAARRLS